MAVRSASSATGHRVISESAHVRRSRYPAATTSTTTHAPPLIVDRAWPRASVTSWVPFGRTEAPPTGSRCNSIHFSSTGDRFVDNGAPAVTLTASDRLVNGTMSGGENHDNRVEAEFVNVRIEGAAPGLLAIGGRYRGTGAKSGTGNVVTLAVRAAGTATPAIQPQDNEPAVDEVTPPNRVVSDVSAPSSR